MSLLGNINLTQTFPETGPNFHDKDNDYFLEFKSKYPEDSAVILEHATSREVRPLKRTVEAALKKNDNPFFYPEDCPHHVKACEYLELYLAPLLTAPVVMPHEPIEYNVNSSSGLLGKKTGFPKTKDYLDSPTFKRYELDTEHIPISIINLKPEFLDKEVDLSRDKARLVDCPDKTFIKKQKILYDHQNKKLMDSNRDGYLAYGFVKQYGGFSNLISEFEMFIILSLTDVSGWDKCAIFTFVYYLRNKYLIFPRLVEGAEFLVDLYQRLKRYVTYYTLNPIRLAPNGDIILQDHSNISGQNNTTPDNCILHLLIKFCLVLSLYWKKHQEYPTYKFFRTLFGTKIYSDDKIFGLSTFWHDLDLLTFSQQEREIYKKYNMTVKESASRCFVHESGTQFITDTLEFLGSESYWCEDLDIYLPVPRMGKLCTSLCKSLVGEKRRLTPTEQFSKLVMIFSLFTKVDPLVKKALEVFICFHMENFPEYIAEYNSLLETFDVRTAFNSSNAFRFLITGNESTVKIFSPVEFVFLSMGCSGRLDLISFIVSMNPQIVKAENKIEHHIGGNKVTPEGRHWLEHALDPFKDLPQAVQGYPDTHSGVSIVQVIKGTKTISAPAGIAAGQTWSCNLFLDCVATPFGLAATDIDITNGLAYRNTQGSTLYTNGGLVTRKAIGNGLLNMVTTNNTDNCALDPTYYSNSETRVLAQGFEVHNITDPLHKNGTVCYYRIPSEEEEGKVWTLLEDTGVTACVPSSKMTIGLPMIPESTQQCLLLPGSIQAEAKDGAYVVSLLAKDRNPAKERNASYYTRKNTDFFAGLTYASPMVTVGAAKLIYSSEIAQSVPFLIGGAFFSGLSPESVLQVNVNWILERFLGGTADKDLITMATPTAPYDPKILELYSLIARDLTTGVPVRDNGLGAWISGIADCIAKYAGPVLSGLGNALTGVQKSEKNAKYREKKKKEAKKVETIIIKESPKKNHNKTIVVQGHHIPKNMPKLPHRPGNLTKGSYSPARTNTWTGTKGDAEKMMALFKKEYGM